MRTDLDSYADGYQHVRLSRADGVLEAVLHSDGGTLLWNPVAMQEIRDLFARVAEDAENRVLLLTGAGNAFCDDFDRHAMGGSLTTPLGWETVDAAGRALMRNLLDLPCLTVAAVNGPARIHSELLVLSDVVVASETAVFQDSVHFQTGGVPGDGSHFVWPLLLGPNRGRYFLVTGQELSAGEAMQLGVVSEVLPPDTLMARARELAARLAAHPPLSIRHTRRVLTHELKRLAWDHGEYGYALEGLGLIQRDAAATQAS